MLNITLIFSFVGMLCIYCVFSFFCCFCLSMLWLYCCEIKINIIAGLCMGGGQPFAVNLIHQFSKLESNLIAEYKTLSCAVASAYSVNGDCMHVAILAACFVSQVIQITEICRFYTYDTAFTIRIKSVLP